MDKQAIKLTMYQVAEILNTSHTTIYSKINNEEIKKELESFIVYQGKSKYLKPEGIEILRKYMKDNFDKSLENINKHLEENNKSLESEEELSTKNNSKIIGNVDNKTLEMIISTLESKNKDYIESLRSQIDELNKKLGLKENQLDYKDKQIETMTFKLSEALEASNKLVENNQILLGQLQNNVMFIESSKKEKRSFWSIFKKN
jgi:hypothetical protein